MKQYFAFAGFGLNATRLLPFRAPPELTFLAALSMMTTLKSHESFKCFRGGDESPFRGNGCCGEAG